MNQINIGKFIAQCRKEKKLTQAQLAEKLNITDRAVSKWETYRSFPDVSLLTPLCTLLGITINELFAGEHISQEKWKEKTDEILMEVITNWLGHDQWEPEKTMQQDQMYWRFVMFQRFTEQEQQKQRQSTM